MCTYFFLSKSQIHFTIQLPKFSRETVHFAGIFSRSIYLEDLNGKRSKKILLPILRGGKHFCVDFSVFFNNFPRKFFNEYVNQPLYIFYLFVPGLILNDNTWKCTTAASLVVLWYANGSPALTEMRLTYPQQEEIWKFMKVSYKYFWVKKKN